MSRPAYGSLGAASAGHIVHETPVLYAILLWLGDEQWSMPSFGLMSLCGVGATAIIYRAGLQGIPPDLYKAADKLESQNHVQQQVGRKMGKHSGF